MVSVKQLLAAGGKGVIAVEPGETVYNAIGTMAAHGIGAVLVMAGNRLVGIMSERDYTRKIVLRDRSSRTTRVEEIMTADVVHVTPGNDLSDCMRTMSDHRIRHLPVVDATGTVLGMVSILEVLRALLDDREHEIRDLERYIAGSA
ncbi:MAG: CBS domain-containing protein [Gammaproteobacteria bacterium]